MPIRDPGNAGSANEDHETLHRISEATDQADRARRLLALLLGLITALVLIPSVLLALFADDWRWFAGGLAIWLGLAVLSSSVTTFRYGPRS